MKDPPAITRMGLAKIDADFQFMHQIAEFHEQRTAA